MLGAELAPAIYRTVNSCLITQTFLEQLPLYEILFRNHRLLEPPLNRCLQKAKAICFWPEYWGWKQKRWIPNAGWDLQASESPLPARLAEQE